MGSHSKTESRHLHWIALTFLPLNLHFSVADLAGTVSSLLSHPYTEELHLCKKKEVKICANFKYFLSLCRQLQITHTSAIQPSSSPFGSTYTVNANSSDSQRPISPLPYGLWKVLQLKGIVDNGLHHWQCCQRLPPHHLQGMVTAIGTLYYSIHIAPIPYY